MALRQHDVVLADGRFRVVLTDRRRLFAVIDAPETALGPLHLAFEIDRRPHFRPQVSVHTTAGLLDGVARAASEGAFRAASQLAPSAAAPAFAVVRDVASHGTDMLGSHLAEIPESARKSVESAARLALRARLGDVSAKRFVESVARAVRSGSPAARPVGDALLAGGRIVSRVLDAAPLHAFDEMASALQRGDLGAIETVATHLAKDVAPEVTELVDSLDDYVKQFTTAGVPHLSREDEEDIRGSGRLVQPLSRCIDPHLVTVGLDLGAALTDAGSGNIGGAIGDIGGAGAAKGAAIGGAIGSVIPGIGTAIGGAIGGIIGGIGSLFGSSGPIDFEHLPGGLGQKLIGGVADHIRRAPRWQAHFPAVYRHLPAGTAGHRGLNDLVAHALFPRDEWGKDATTGHPDGLAEWFAAQPDWQHLLHGPGVPPGDRHQLEARIHAVHRRRALLRGSVNAAFRPLRAILPSLPAITVAGDCGCSPNGGRS